MKVVIIEDESLVAESLSTSLKTIRPGIIIECILGSVKESIDYFKHHPQPDLIFSDIQLGDGLSFEISKHIEINVPVIFCTAFDDYALEAFKVSGIAYILKPFSIDSLENAITKFEHLKIQLTGDMAHQYEIAMQALASYKLKDSGTFMVKYRDRFLPISFDKIAFFHIEYEISSLYTHTAKTYVIPETLEELEKKLGTSFFRVNRQFLINRNAILEVKDHFPRRLKVNLKIPFNKDIIVSKEKRKILLDWLQQ
ncbi:two component transcriptional regulator, LytTR family [Chitinophaga sp. CF118]|uniref:LytR/AlgR family response regulator transcription factor n=1 Tax=Chitinophaga sp. CF118 TaxID=1884367 RepID=UPI0008EC0F78|nr:LytTR family DNA-binding domain-containing protein [Chitinophaga sp. CF118]SFD87365.1 two component transcriptional regulator, LytTR family [Chitinophaga sp. CF118]